MSPSYAVLYMGLSKLLGLGLRSFVVHLFSSFTQSQYDSSLFYHKSAVGMVILLVYVDDILNTGTDSNLITKLQQLLHATFHMKDLGQLKYFLGLEVHHRANSIFLNQHIYIQDTITLAGLEDTSSVVTPMEHLHLVAVQRIIRYLRGSPTRGLFFPTSFALQLFACSDADWVGCPCICLSTTGWCMFLGDALIPWKCKKQDRVSKSSTEAEYRAMSTTCSEIISLRGLLAELQFPQTTSTPLHADNTSAIQIATNPIFHERTKHIEVDCHSICDTLERQVISLSYISSDL
ncbi:uncharacterized mitochondrial protein AtMg00810-like [Aristolochia californica]|uniref:uncharacterized mitochondrial protein AtMg00810-like n=1 Tax=Aristolochia californica TaxID=171875 RepID=UPI0035D834D6